MITENDVMIDDIADEIFENIEQAIDRELEFIMEEYGLNEDMINKFYDAWLLKKLYTEILPKLLPNEEFKNV